MKRLDAALTQWGVLQNQIRTLTTQKKDMEREVLSIMKETKWTTYNSPDNITVSLTEEEVAEIDRGQLKLMLPKKDIEAITIHRMEKRMTIITPESRKLLKKTLGGLA